MTWLPGLVVLVAGLAAGFLITRGLRRGRRAPSDAGAGAGSLQLRIADLGARRDDLYARLREIGRGIGPEEDRATLELAAARTLRDLDRLEGELGKRHPKVARQKKKAAEATEESPAAAPVPSQSRHFITGFAYGAGLLLLVGALVYWAGRDAQPRPDQAGPAPGPGSAEEPHSGDEELPPEVANRVAEISRYLVTQPDDLQARKDLGYTYLGASRFVEAFRQAEEILARSPEDPDGLYMQALVRLTMGQVEIAGGLLERALTSDPEHVDSLTATGIILLQGGDYQQAIATWKRGLAAMGGSQPMIEGLIRLAEEGRPVEEIIGMPQSEVAPAEARSEPAAAPPAAVPMAAAAPDVITISLELAPGATAVPGSTLFVILRGSGGGPPVAVKRLSSPTFPLTVTLGQADSMMGSPIPESGLLTARLDLDGSASTRDPRDLEASAEAGLGDVLTLSLSPGG